MLLTFALIADETVAGGSFDPSTVGHFLAYVDTIGYIHNRPLGYGISFAGTRPFSFPLW